MLRPRRDSSRDALVPVGARLRLTLGGAFLVALLLVGCSGSGEKPGSEDDGRLASAMCSDLSDGLSMFQMHSQAVDFYTRTGRSGDAAQLAAAQLEDLATSEYCPEFRDAFEATFAYEEWIAR